MATLNRKFGSNTQSVKVKDDNEAPNQASVRSSQPAGTRVETQTTPPNGLNKEVWQQAEAQVVSTFGGLDDNAKKAAVKARYDSMVASDKQVKDWAGGDKEILGDIGQKGSK